MGCANKKNTCCCKKCNTCHDCYQHDDYRIKELLYSIYIKLANYYEAKLCSITWGYSCNDLDSFEYRKLIIYRKTLEKHHLALLGGYQPCLCPEELQLVIDGVLELVDISCCKSDTRCDIVVTDSNYNDWILYNKYCISYEVWEKALYRACNVFSYTISEIPNPQNLIYTLKVLQLATEQQCFDSTIGTDYLNKISVELLKECDTLSINSELMAKLKDNHSKLIEEIKCDFDFKIYSSLIACNFTNEVIVNLIKCGVEVSYNVEEKECILTYKNKAYRLQDMKISTDLSNCDPGFNLVDITSSYTDLVT